MIVSYSTGIVNLRAKRKPPFGAVFRVLNGIQLNLAVLSGQVSAHQRLITGDDGGGQRILDLLLNQAAQIAGAYLIE